MKRIFILLCGLLALASPLSAYKVLYAEQWYKLVHRHLYQDPDRVMENIRYLEEALKADFANPLNAMARISNKTQWERYRYLFYTQVNLTMVEQHIVLAKSFDKMFAYFYNYPWKSANLKSLEQAEKVYEFTKYYWEKAKEWSAKANEPRFQFLYLPEVQFWIDQSHRIETGDLNYGQILNKHLTRLRRVREDFEAMDKTTY